MKFKFFFSCFLFLFLNSWMLSAHVGSPDIFYEGNAGPYKIDVFIQPPDVVPGIAKIYVTVHGNGVSKVRLQPVYFQYGSEGAPDADLALKTAGVNKFEGQLWLMAFGSASVKISLEGIKGMGNTIIPVAAVATATRKMESGTVMILIPLGILLFAGLITIIGVSVSQAIIPKNVKINEGHRKKSYKVMTVFSVFLAIAIYFANSWWSSVEAKYKENMFKPLTMESSIVSQSDKSEIYLRLKNSPWLERKLTDIVPDHGKIMHLFLVSKNGSVFSHLHPQKIDSSIYSNVLPKLESGEYSVFADVIHENGMSETIVDTLIVGKTIYRNVSLNEDDAFYNYKSNEVETNGVLNIAMIPNKDLVTKKLIKLSFQIKEKNGKEVDLQPYLGMAGHAVVLKEDHSVFVHLHPMGTVSMASQAALAKKVVGEITLCNDLNDTLKSNFNKQGLADVDAISTMVYEDDKNYKNKILTFPYAFPNSGKYFIWVQVKKDNEIITQRFSVSVK